MAPTLITYEEAKATIGTLLSLDPRPNSVNIRALLMDLEQKLETIPSHQSPEHGYAGMVMDPALYALRAPTTPWTGRSGLIQDHMHRRLTPQQNKVTCAHYIMMPTKPFTTLNRM
jgi:hypothetical protein